MSSGGQAFFKKKIISGDHWCEQARYRFRPETTDGNVNKRLLSPLQGYSDHKSTSEGTPGIPQQNNTAALPSAHSSTCLLFSYQHYRILGPVCQHLSCLASIYLTVSWVLWCLRKLQGWISFSNFENSSAHALVTCGRATYVR